MYLSLQVFPGTVNSVPPSLTIILGLLCLEMIASSSRPTRTLEIEVSATRARESWVKSSTTLHPEATAVAEHVADKIERPALDQPAG
jgi:hypothetical protein